MKTIIKIYILPNIMPVSLIACVAIYKNKLAIGFNNNLLFDFAEDKKFFKHITSTKIQELPNVVLMGNKTYNSIPKKYTPLKNRINIVLTRFEKIITDMPNLSDPNLDLSKPYYLSLNSFIALYNKFNINVFVIGGGEINNYFLGRRCVKNLTPTKLYITHVLNPKFTDIPNVFMNNFGSKYKLISYSEKITQLNLSFRILTYNLINQGSYSVLEEEEKYECLLEKIIKTGTERSDRTGTGTIGIFGTSMKFDVSSSVPMMTSRQIPFKAIVEELLWFCRGDTDAKVLQNKGIMIWNGNTSRAFLDGRNLQDYPEGVLGAGYGFQWKHWGADYNVEYADTNRLPNKGAEIGGIDQIEYCINLLKTDPFSRRIMLTAWNPSDFNKVALVPCHVTLQFYVEEIASIKYLSCQFTMRSSDVALASCYNVMSYTILLYIIAAKCDMRPKNVIYVAGDAHIYKTHLDAVTEQLHRSLRPAPKLYLDKSIKEKKWHEMQFSDFELIGYMPHSAIKMNMAV